MKILNFGSLNIDYVYNVERFVNPGETISAKNMQIFCGGKGLNQSIALARAGADVYHAGKIGKDGNMLKKRLEENNINTEYLKIDKQNSGHAIIEVDKTGQNCIIIYGGANRDITQNDIDKTLKNFDKGDMLVLQNEINNIDYIMERAHEMGMIIAFNPSPMSEDVKKYPLEHVKYLIINEVEGRELTGETNGDDIAESIIYKYPDCVILLTLGTKGVLYCDKQKRLTHGIYKVETVDTTGAGDTFTGYFLSGVIEGLPMEKVLERASIASSICVSRAGAGDSIPLKSEVLESKLELL